jgi:hypothetical protein
MIDAKPISTITTATIQPKELEDPEEGERFFHSQMWVNGNPMHFIVDRRSQKNLISSEVIEQLGLVKTLHLQPIIAQVVGWENPNLNHNTKITKRTPTKFHLI